MDSRENLRTETAQASPNKGFETEPLDFNQTGNLQTDFVRKETDRDYNSGEANINKKDNYQNKEEHNGHNLFGKPGQNVFDEK